MLQCSNGIRNDMKRQSSIKKHTVSTSTAIPLSIRITKKDFLSNSLIIKTSLRHYTQSIPKIDLSLDEETASSPLIKGINTLNLDNANEEKKNYRPRSAAVKAFMYQTTKFASNTFNRRRNSDGFDTFLVSGSAVAKKKQNNFKKTQSGRKWILYRGRSLF